MITNEQVKDFASKYQTTELNVKREYFQHIFLSYFYQQPQTSNIYFKGGTALHLLYKSPRFSEDLDFSSPVKTKSAIEQPLLKTLYEIGREGIVADIQEAKPTSGGYLAEISFSNNGQSIEILLQISFRGTKKSGEAITVVSDLIPPYNLVSLAQDQLITEKIQALLSRKKPRDFYDFYFILRANILPAQQKNTLLKVSELIKKTDINFERELKQFLPKSHWTIIHNFEKSLEREIQKYI
ncbi:MAG: nucleotidyl transferase AbiEii/AbiGii toxin family protein [Patescibacteria group bacterium]